MLAGINNFHSMSIYKTRFRNTKVRGFTLIEVLVTLLVFSVGLLGYAALQSRVVKAQLEVYQRVYALNLVDYIVDQIRANPAAQGCYNLANLEVGSGYSGSYSCSSYGTTDTQAQVIEAVNQWSDLLKGSAEVSAGSDVGGLPNARGCIVFDSLNKTFVVSVVWQGLIETVAPTSTNCGNTNYGGPSSAFRRALTYKLQTPIMDN